MPRGLTGARRNCIFSPGLLALPAVGNCSTLWLDVLSHPAMRLIGFFLLRKLQRM